MTAVIVDGQRGKDYRLATDIEVMVETEAEQALVSASSSMPFGIPVEPVPKGGSRASGGSPFTVHLYGLDEWRKLFTSRQLLAAMTFARHTRAAADVMRVEGYPSEWIEATMGYLAICVDRLVDYNSSVCNWDPNGEYITHTFQRCALPIKWDFSEINPISDTTGGYIGGIDWASRYITHALSACAESAPPRLLVASAMGIETEPVDVILTDPPYYDAIPYSDLMDVFFVWLRRTLNGVSMTIDAVTREPLAPKWDARANDGELIDDPSRFGGDKALSGNK